MVGRRSFFLPKPKIEANNWSARPCCFDQLNMSNHSPLARGTDPPFSHKRVVSSYGWADLNIIYTKTLIGKQLFAGRVKVLVWWDHLNSSDKLFIHIGFTFKMSTDRLPFCHLQGDEFSVAIYELAFLNLMMIDRLALNA